MFVVGSTGDDVNQYTLTTAFDVSTATFVDSFSVAAQETAPTGVAFSSDGTKMFVVGTSGDDVNEYTLTTPFDVSTATFADSFSVAGQEIFSQGLAFSSDGAKMFVVGSVGDDINEYTLTTAFDVSTATFVDSFSVAGWETGPTGVAFSTDGAKMFVVGNIGSDVNEYTLSTGFDVSTATFVDSFSVAGQETMPRDVAFSSDDTKMFVIGPIGLDVNEYNITLIIPSCSPPSSGIWIITENCKISSDIIAPASVMIQNNSVVIINSGGSLMILSGENVIIVNGSALKLIQGSNLQINS